MKEREKDMRKRKALFLAALLLFLSACAAKPGVITPSVQPTALPTQTPVPTPEVSPKVLLPNGPLPKTEYESAGQPERAYEDVTKTLIPSSGYGHIWPYVGGFLTAEMGRSSFYGLCDDKGRIICDPVYHNVDILEKDGTKLYRLIKKVSGGKSRFRPATKITLARPDGSWADEFDELYTMCSASEYPPVKTKNDNDLRLTWRLAFLSEYITVRKGEKWGVIDYTGNEILPCSYNAPLFFSEGLAAVLSDDLKAVSYIDSSGKTILGPYQAPPKPDNSFEDFSAPLPMTYGLVFYEGKTRFYKDGKFGVIDKSGNIIIPAKYDYITSFSGGTAEFISEGKKGVLGPNGEVLLDQIEEQIENGGNGTVIFWEYGKNPAELNLTTKERKPWSNNKTFSYSYENDGVTLKLKNRELHIPGDNSIFELNSGNIVISTRIQNKEPTWIIINPDGETVAGPTEGRVDYYSKQANNGIIYINLGMPEHGTMWDFQYIAVYDEKGKRLLHGEYLSVEPYDGKYLVRTEAVSGLMNDDGSWFIKAPLYEYRAD